MCEVHLGMVERISNIDGRELIFKQHCLNTDYFEKPGTPATRPESEKFYLEITYALWVVEIKRSDSW